MPMPQGDNLPTDDDDAAMPESAGSTYRSEPGVAAPRGGLPRPALIGAGLVGAILLILVAILLLRPDDEPIAHTSPSASSASPPSTSTGPATPSASTEQGAIPTYSPPPSEQESWTEVAEFAEPGNRYVLGDMEPWAGGVVAVGTLYEEQAFPVFGPPPPRSGRVWRSTDGTDWAEATPPDTFADVELTHLFETGDGALIVIGNAWTDVEPTSLAWETLDGETWMPVVLDGMPAGAKVDHLASGAQGHVASAHLGQDSHVMYSSGGRSWQPTLDTFTFLGAVAAGDEGFVASFFREGPATGVLASADGLEWIASPELTEQTHNSVLPAPRGADWFATTATFGTAPPGVPAVRGWTSANGLDWTEAGEIPSAQVELGDVTCAEIPAALHGLPGLIVLGTTLAGPCGEGGVIAAGGSYSSTDGIEWTRLPFGDHAFAAGAAMVGDRIVVGTDARTSQADVISVTFWSSD